MDLWELHEAGDSRAVPSASILCHYGLSASTEQVVFFQRPASGAGGEIRIYGPEGRFVWYELPHKINGEYSLVGGLFSLLEKQGKLIIYR